MTTKFFIVLAVGVCTALSVACKKNESIGNIEKPDAENGAPATLTLSIGSSALTKASTGSTDDDCLKTVEVFVFDAAAGSKSNGILEVYKKASLDAVNSATMSLDATAGPKHIYVLANAESTLAESINNEAALQAAVSNLKANKAGGFIMSGGCEKTLVSGDNDISVVCRRIVSKVSLQSVSGAFESPALQQGTFKIDKIYLMNVPKQAKYINGNASDVFGVSGSTALNTGDANYPSLFNAALNGSSKLPYYLYAAPAADSTSANGFYNYRSNFSYEGGIVPTSNAGVKKLTWVEPAGGNTLYPSGSHIYNADIDFYCYPNSTEQSASETTPDNTTKLVLQTTLTLNNTKRTYYYSIGIPYTQPNYHYSVSNVTIKRLGSEDPSIPVSKATCSFTITVKDWETGKIVGQYNNETSDGNFEF